MCVCNSQLVDKPLSPPVLGSWTDESPWSDFIAWRGHRGQVTKPPTVTFCTTFHLIPTLRAANLIMGKH